MRALGVVMLLSVLCAGGVHAQATPTWQRIELGTSARAYPFAIYSNQPWSGDMSRVKSAVLVFHGLGRNGNNYYAAAEKLLRASGANTGETLVIAPNFFAPADRSRQPLDGMPLWRGAHGWNAGWDAANWPRPLSAFEPIDDLLRALSDRKRFPALERIVLAGHSGGGQLVQRYAVLNTADEAIRAAGIALRYIVANPSSYLYFTNERPQGETFPPYPASSCPGYNDYKYGLDKMVRYAAGADGASLFRRYAARDVTYLLGSADNDPNHRQLDKTCAAEAEGATRLERGRDYIRYERYLAGPSLALNRHAYEVVGVGHSQARMLGSKCAGTLLFGMPESKNETGADCRAIIPAHSGRP